MMSGRLIARCLVAVTSLALAGCVAHLAFGIGGEKLDAFFNDWLYNAVLVAAAIGCLVRGATGGRAARPWLLVGLGMGSWAAADIYYSVALAHLDEIPFPSIDDAMYLGFYPPVYVALILLVRARTSSFRPSMWLDGVSGALAVGAIGSAVVFQAVLSSVAGSSTSVVATNLAYPLADLLLLAILVACAALSGWRVDRGSALLAAGFALFAITDSIYLYQVAAGTYVDGGILDAGWLIAAALFPVAAWQPFGERRAATPESWQTLIFPAGAGLVGVGVLVADHFHRVTLMAVVLASAGILAVIARLALTFAEYLGMIEASLAEANTDALTGMPNRRQLMRDLDEAFVSGGSRLLALFDLDGFKLYNDTFGHLAGDALLARLGRRLEVAVDGAAYRMGGDEFCVLLPVAAGEDGLAACRAALAEAGQGFSISVSYGVVEVPVEADNPSDALKTADQRMYQQKRGRRPSAGRQSADVLRAVVEVRDMDLGEHGTGVAELARAVAEGLGLALDQCEEVALAGQLHDIGKIGLPEAILNKPGALDEREWEFMKSHTLIGERILRSAPALTGVSKLVRSSHEWYDGGGYPDGLMRDEIPLGARIITVCDAYDAMVSHRVYAAACTHHEALEELVRCAGSQFDPAVVAAFCAAFESDALSVLRAA
jgi:two-component system cell cycle response regulator